MKTLFYLIAIFFLVVSCQNVNDGDYVCTPCDLPCDTISFSKAGICPHCKMPLVLKSELMAESTLQVNDIHLSTGSGVFLVEGGKDREEKTIKVYYHQPVDFGAESKVLLVIPGAGRNGDSYRDAWIEESEKYNVLILSPMYAEDDYGFEDYHLGGLISNPNLREVVTYVDNTNHARLNEEHFTFDVVNDPTQWLFADFDRIFDQVISATGTGQSRYDMFGHSAGGQILHRYALCIPHSKADRIIAGNAGFFTLPDVSIPLPFGLKNTNIDEASLKASYARKLTLLLGELDNEDETGGTLLRSPTADAQGTHRLARGQYFYNMGKKNAEGINAEFNWILEIVPDVGHNHRLMGDAAAKILYD